MCNFRTRGVFAPSLQFYHTTFAITCLRCRPCSSAFRPFLTCAHRLRCHWQLSVITSAHPMAHPSARAASCAAPGLEFCTVDSVTRISAMSAAAARAGAQIGDALFEIGKANVSGVSAQHIAPFFVGPAGTHGSFLLVRHNSAVMVLTRVFSASDCDQGPRRWRGCFYRIMRAACQAHAGTRHSDMSGGTE